MTKHRAPKNRVRAKEICSCYICCGRPRQPRTVVIHASRARYVPEVMVDSQMPANQNEEDKNTSDSEEEVDDPDPWKSAFDSISGLMQPVGAGENQPSIGVVLITVLDLMTKHKATDAVAKDVIALLHTFVGK